MKVHYDDRFFYADVSDPEDPPFSEINSFLEEYVNKLISNSIHLPWYARPKKSDYYACQFYMHKMNHYLEGCDCGNVEILDQDLAIAFMIKFKVGNPVHYRLLQDIKNEY